MLSTVMGTSLIINVWSPDQRFPATVLLTFWTGSHSVAWAGPCPREMASSVPSLYPLDTPSTCNNPKCLLDSCQTSMESPRLRKSRLHVINGGITTG